MRLSRIGAWLALFTLTTGALGCREDTTVSVRGLLAMRQTSVEFDPLYVGQWAERTFTVANDGRAELELKWEDPTIDGDELPISAFKLVDQLPSRLRPGEYEVRVRFFGLDIPGDHAARVVARSPTTSEAVILRGTVMPIPECAQPDACQTFHFDTRLEKCVATPVADGLACEAESKCLVGGRCFGGRCVGTPTICDDGNLCTVDVCDSQSGCLSFPGPPCPGDGKCQLGACDPQSGCHQEPAPDGTSCGSLRSCVAADVCIEGVCVIRDPPDGFVCSEASPCQEAGTCQGDRCMVEPKTPLAANYSFESEFSPDRIQYHDFLLEPSGEMSLFGVFSRPGLRMTGAPTTYEAPARRCMLWNGRALCLDVGQEGAVEQGNVALIDPANGQRIWTFRLAKAMPEIVAGVSPLFMGRAAIAGTDRFAALFEGYAPGQGDQCRRYFLIVLNANGELVKGNRVEDPFLDQTGDQCNHPHPFGMGADVAGNFYISFSPSQRTAGGGALQPGSPTLLMAFARDGTPKWRTRLDIRGGELAVGRGLLFPERSPRPVRASDGIELEPSTVDFGRPGVTAEHVLLAPRVGDDWLEARPLASAAPWVYTLEDGMVWATDQLRLATYTPRPAVPPEQIVVSFTQPSIYSVQLPALVGVRTRDGQPAFLCPIDYTSVPIGTEGSPQLFELTNGKLGLMDGTPACGRCDPPYAGTSLGGPPSFGRFFRFDVPTLSPATAPWPGAFGGEGHDHQENTVFRLP